MQKVPIEILAIAIIPGKIMTGICFPDYPIEDRCPCLSLLFSGWHYDDKSSSLIRALSRTSPFAEAYMELKINGKCSTKFISGQVSINMAEIDKKE